MPCSMAKEMSKSVLPLPWKKAFSRGEPARKAVFSSPEDTTSMPMPSSFMISYIRLKLSALLAYRGMEPAGRCSAMAER